MKSISEFKDGAYPMLCRFKLTQKEFNKDTRIANGIAEIEVTDKVSIKVGDELSHHYTGAKIVVTEVIESRQARGQHKIKAIWHKLIGKYELLIAG